MSDRRLRVAELVDAAIWAIEPEWLETIRAIALGEGEGPEAVAARLGRPLQNAQQVEMRGEVAVIPIAGPIFRYANLFTQVSGATSIEIFARDLRTALDEPAVKAIILEINSPGGQVDGINEAANMIRAAEKPIVAYVSGMGASAGYWLAAAADQIVVDDTAQLGSIGVVTTVMRRKPRTAGGAEEIEIVSSQSPNKRPDVETDEGRAQIQARVDAIADVFVDAVARFRGVERATVLSQFGGGGVKVGAAAIAAGMADRNGSLEGTIAELAAGRLPNRRQLMATETQKTYSEADYKAAVDKALDEGMKLGLDEGRKTGASLERDRILGIERVALPGHEKLVAELKADGSTQPSAAAEKILEAEKLTRERRLDAIRQDAAAVDVPAAPSASGDPKPVAEDANRPLEERAKAKWDSDATIRAEFGEDYASYLAWRKADERGDARILRVVGGN